MEAYEKSIRNAANMSLRGPQEWAERVVQVALVERKGVWHASHTVAIQDGKATDYTDCICTPCSREQGRLTRF